MQFFTGLIGKWFLRRGMEIGGLLGALVAYFLSLPPGQQQTILRILQGDWSDIPLGSVVALVVALAGYIWSFISTVRPQVVVNNEQVPIRELSPVVQREVRVEARDAVERKPGLLDRLFGRRG